MIDVSIENIRKCELVELQAITKPNFLLKGPIYFFYRNYKEEEVFFQN